MEEMKTNPSCIIEDFLLLLTQAGLVTEENLDETTRSLPVEGLTYDSKEAAPGTLFLCKGAHFRERYLLEAVSRGAGCYVSQQRYQSVQGPYILVSDIRKAMALLANGFYGQPWKRLKTVGITGTKGKSTTVYFLRSIFDHYLSRMGKKKSGVLSGIENYDGVSLKESHLTTPEALELQKHFANAAASGIEFMEMEVSSQALKYGRVDGVTFDVGCFLNIGEDHISDMEHRDFDDYFESKLKLFQQCKTACINLNSDHIEELIQASDYCEKRLFFGTDSRANVYGKNIRKEGMDTVFDVITPRYGQELRLSLPGLFNVENALAAVAVCEAFQIPAEDVAAGLYQARVSGRMELFQDQEGKVLVIVDYAHNRMSFDRLYTSILREYPDRAILSVFGCPGGKALGRRQELSEIAGRYARRIYVTEEDAGEEPLEQICRELADNIRQTGCPAEIIFDREEAIRQCIEEAKAQAGKTVILLTGKGRETRQKRGTVYVPCLSDVECVEKYL